MHLLGNVWWRFPDCRLWRGTALRRTRPRPSEGNSRVPWLFPAWRAAREPRGPPKASPPLLPLRWENGAANGESAARSEGERLGKEYLDSYKQFSNVFSVLGRAVHSLQHNPLAGRCCACWVWLVQQPTLSLESFVPHLVFSGFKDINNSKYTLPGAGSSS